MNKRKEHISSLCNRIANHGPNRRKYPLGNIWLSSGMGWNIGRWWGERHKAWITSAGSTANESYLVAIHTFERDEFCCEVVAMHGFLAAVAHWTREETVAATSHAC